jgi:hypothetical protein
MKCPGCGCNYFDEEKFCPMCEMRNNALARAAHKLRRQNHTETYGDYTTTCAHPDENLKQMRRRTEQQRAERLGRPAVSTGKPATSSAKPKKNANRGTSMIKIIIGIFIALNFGLPLLFGLLEALIYGIF